MFMTQKIHILNSEKKIVSLSEYTIINTGYLAGKNIGANSDDYVLSTIPLHMSPGLSLFAGLTLSILGKFVFCSELFDAEETIKAIKLENVTLLIGLPEHFEEILKNIKNNKLPTLKKAIVASIPNHMPSSNLLKRIKDELQLETVSLTFGVQESGGVITQSVNNFSPNNIGKPLQHTKVKIVDSKGNPVSTGKEGELLVQGFNVMKEYKNDSESTNKKIVSGFLRTGVKAKIDNNNDIIVI